MHAQITHLLDKVTKLNSQLRSRIHKQNNYERNMCCTIAGHRSGRGQMSLFTLVLNFDLVALNS